MPAPVFIGDELSGAAYRLGGARVRMPSPEDTVSAFTHACSEAELVLITAEFAQRLPLAELLRARAGTRPLVLLVPDVQGRHAVADLSRWLRAQLGLEG